MNISINEQKRTATLTIDGKATDLGTLAEAETKLSRAGLRRRARKVATKRGLVKAGVLVECTFK